MHFHNTTRLVNRTRLLAGLLAVCAVLSSPAKAQTVRGVVTDRATGNPVGGVVMTLLDSLDRTPRRAMTDQTGAFAILAPGAGTYQLRAMRIGFRPFTTDRFAVVLGLTDLAPIRLTGIPVSLETIRVTTRDVCGGARDEGFATIWDQARTAVTAAQLTAASRGLTARTVSYERTLDPRTGRIQAESSSVSRAFVTQPWRAASPAQLRRDGYVTTDQVAWITYRAPGLTALASDEFIEDHCFRVDRPRNGEVAVRFEPTRERREIPEIAGTIWLDAATSELRRMEYRYVNVSDVQENEAGGAMEFGRFRDGGWAVTRWSIRMPTVEQVIIGGRPTLRVHDIRVAGGDLSLAMRDADTLWARGAVAVSGTVVDSATGAAIAGARLQLAGTALRASSGTGGEFRLQDVLPGEYTLEVRTTALDSLGAVQQLPILVAQSAENLQVRVGRPRPRLATFAGVVVADSIQQPIAEAAVILPDLERSTYTDSSGNFVMEGIPPGEHRVVVRRLGFGPLDTQLAFAPNQQLNRRIVLQAVAALDTVSVIARSLIPSFDEHRAQGLGQFLTRDELQKMAGRRMSDVLQSFRGVRIVTSQGKAWLATGRRSSMTLRPADPSQGNYQLVPGEGYCLAQIYVNGSLWFLPKAGEPVPDLNEFTPDQIEAVEYYETQAQVPLRYSRGDTNCGVLVIHTRRGSGPARR